jgi:hypothetical protein
MNPSSLTPFAFPMENMGVESLICYAKSQAVAWKEFAETLSETYAEHHKVAKKPAKKTKKSVSKNEVTEPVVEPEVTEPVVEPEVTEPVVEPEVTEPVVEPEVTEPVVEPEVTEPVVEPEVTEPVVEPEVTEPVVEPEVIRKTIEEIYEWFDYHMKESGYAMKVFEQERVESDIAKFLPEVESYSEEERERFWNHVNKSVQTRQLEAHVVFLEDDILKKTTAEEVYQEVKGRFPLLTENEYHQIIAERLQFMRDARKEGWEKAAQSKPEKKSGKKKKVIEAEEGTERLEEDNVSERLEEDNVSETGTEKSKGDKKKRGPTNYNLFIKAEIARIREQDPSIKHNVVMSMAAAAWKTQKVQSKLKTELDNTGIENTDITLELALSA